MDGSLFAEEHSLATTGSPVAFQIVFTPFWHLVGLSSSAIIRLWWGFYMDSLMVVYSNLQLFSTLVELYLLLVEVHLLVELLYGGILLTA